jgi:hypothetical protein
MDVLADDELRALVRSMIAWGVRGLVVGGIGGGTYERYYADAAARLRSVRRASRALVRNALQDVVPGDAEFTRQFAHARIRNLRLAGYYLRAIENVLAQHSDPMLVPEAAEEESYVIKVMGPRAAAADWKGFDQDEIASMSYRLGNAVLLEPELAAGFAEASWRRRLQILGESRFATTQTVAKFAEWSPKALDKRQSDLAEHASRVWPR